jgi:hypothetical protein
VSYTTLDKVANEIKGTLATAPSATPQQVMGYARTVTDRIRRFGFEFEPLYKVKKITPTPRNVNSLQGLLSLGDQLLEVVSITVGGTTYAYGTDLVSEPDNGQSPVKTLRIANLWSGVLRSWYSCNIASPAAYYNSIVINGFFGMREFYAEQGWLDSGVVCPVLTSADLTAVVTDVAGPDAYGRTPLFSPGNLIRIENELIEIVDVVTSTKTLKLRRGQRGTTAAAHAAGLAIRIWELEEDIVNAATRQAALLYARRGAYMQTTTYPDGISVSYPSDLLAELRATVQRFNYL